MWYKCTFVLSVGKEDDSWIRTVTFGMETWPWNPSLKVEIREETAETLIWRRLHICKAASRSCGEQVELHKRLPGRTAVLQVQQAAPDLTSPGHNPLRSDSSGFALCVIINTAAKGLVSGCKMLPISKASFYHHFTPLWNRSVGYGAVKNQAWMFSSLKNELLCEQEITRVFHPCWTCTNFLSLSQKG